jgi:D-glycero-alpha-D-manno-heptose-7-phosphate kinase
MISVRTVLEDHQVSASAPCRIDSGGTWDIKAMALPFEGIGPTTVNVALSLRTKVILTPFDDGSVRIVSKGFRHSEVFSADQLSDQLSFESPLSLFLAAVSYFGFHGLEISISSQSPVKSALGGSSTALVALIKALSKLSVFLGGKGISARKILHLSYHLEDAISGGNCGLQDQAAAVFGGINQWKWCYGNAGAPFVKTSLLDRNGQREFSRRLLVAYSGKSHISARVNRNWISGFLSGRTRAGWIKVNKVVHRFAEAVKEQDWRQAVLFLKEETGLRKELTPEALIPVTERMVEQAESAGCGARFAGAGAGGSLWALGEPHRIGQLRRVWSDTLSPIRGARILDCDVDAAGVR